MTELAAQPVAESAADSSEPTASPSPIPESENRRGTRSEDANPRTEARYSQNFRTGVRLFSADVFWERNVNNGTIVMQVHTTTTGIGPVYMVAEGNNVSPINGSRVPGGLFDRWINLKVEINAANTASRYWVNNCLVHTQGSGTRGSIDRWDTPAADRRARLPSKPFQCTGTGPDPSARQRATAAPPRTGPLRIRMLAVIKRLPCFDYGYVAVPI